MKWKHTNTANGFCNAAGKVAFTTKVRAETAAKRSFRTRGDVLRVYFCPACRRWHLAGKLSKRKPKPTVDDK